MTKLAIILGSTRPNRFGDQIAAWVKSVADDAGQAVTLIDLQEVNLPFLDEPGMPMEGNYQNAHTKAWAKTIGEYDGFVIVTPEYNFGYPAALKNALDFLYAEWSGKPVAFVSYGASAGGARAVAQLREVVANLNMFDLRDTLAIVRYWEQKDGEGKFQPTEQQTKVAKELLEHLAFWAAHMQKARAELAAQQA